jgi:hypothetical protein
MLFAVYLHAACATDIDGDQFAPVEEILGAGRFDGLKRKRRRHRHGAADDHAVVVGISQTDSPFVEQVADMEMMAQFVRPHGCGRVRIDGETRIIVDMGMGHFEMHFSFWFGSLNRRGLSLFPQHIRHAGRSAAAGSAAGWP